MPPASAPSTRTIIGYDEAGNPIYGDPVPEPAPAEAAPPPTAAPTSGGGGSLVSQAAETLPAEQAPPVMEPAPATAPAPLPVDNPYNDEYSGMGAMGLPNAGQPISQTTGSAPGNTIPEPQPQTPNGGIPAPQEGVMGAGKGLNDLQVSHAISQAYPQSTTSIQRSAMARGNGQAYPAPRQSGGGKGVVRIPIAGEEYGDRAVEGVKSGAGRLKTDLVDTDTIRNQQGLGQLLGLDPTQDMSEQIGRNAAKVQKDFLFGLAGEGRMAGERQANMALDIGRALNEGVKIGGEGLGMLGSTAKILGQSIEGPEVETTNIDAEKLRGPGAWFQEMRNILDEPGRKIAETGTTIDRDLPEWWSRSVLDTDEFEPDPNAPPLTLDTVIADLGKTYGKDNAPAGSWDPLAQIGRDWLNQPTQIERGAPAETDKVDATRQNLKDMGAAVKTVNENVSPALSTAGFTLDSFLDRASDSAQQAAVSLARKSTAELQQIAAGPNDTALRRGARALLAKQGQVVGAEAAKFAEKAMADPKNQKLVQSARTLLTRPVPNASGLADAARAANLSEPTANRTDNPPGPARTNLSEPRSNRMDNAPVAEPRPAPSSLVPQGRLPAPPPAKRQSGYMTDDELASLLAGDRTGNPAAAPYIPPLRDNAPIGRANLPTETPSSSRSGSGRAQGKKGTLPAPPASTRDTNGMTDDELASLLSGDRRGTPVPEPNLIDRAVDRARQIDDQYRANGEDPYVFGIDVNDARAEAQAVGDAARALDDRYRRNGEDDVVFGVDLGDTAERFRRNSNDPYIFGLDRNAAREESSRVADNARGTLVDFRDRAGSMTDDELQSLLDTMNDPGFGEAARAATIDRLNSGFIPDVGFEAPELSLDDIMSDVPEPAQPGGRVGPRPAEGGNRTPFTIRRTSDQLEPLDRPVDRVPFEEPGGGFQIPGYDGSAVQGVVRSPVNAVAGWLGFDPSGGSGNIVDQSAEKATGFTPGQLVAIGRGLADEFRKNGEDDTVGGIRARDVSNAIANLPGYEGSGADQFLNSLAEAGAQAVGFDTSGKKGDALQQIQNRTAAPASAAGVPEPGATKGRDPNDVDLQGTRGGDSNNPQPGEIYDLANGSTLKVQDDGTWTITRPDGTKNQIPAGIAQEERERAVLAESQRVFDEEVGETVSEPNEPNETTVTKTTTQNTGSTERITPNATGQGGTTPVITPVTSETPRGAPAQPDYGGGSDGGYQRSSGGYTRSSSGGGYRRSSGGSSSSFRRRKSKKGFGGNPMFGEGFPFDRQDSPLRQQILATIAASMSKSKSKKKGK